MGMATDGNPAAVDAASLWNQLWALECAYWADVDFNNGKTAPEFYTDDAVFDIGVPGALLQGRSAIKAFYGRRRETPRTTLHIVNNFALVQWSATSARCRLIASLYGRDGAPPQESASPIIMTSGENSYVADGGGWKISSRLNTPWFVDEKHLPVQLLRGAVNS
jgi:hypothetical protein